MWNNHFAAFKKLPSSKPQIIEDITAGCLAWCGEHRATEEDAIVKLKNICARALLGGITGIALKAVATDERRRLANRKAALPSFEFVVGKAPGIHYRTK